MDASPPYVPKRLEENLLEGDEINLSDYVLGERFGQEVCSESVEKMCSECNKPCLVCFLDFEFVFGLDSDVVFFEDTGYLFE